MKVDYLIIGGGIAGTTAAETIRTKAPGASVTIVTNEEDRLYSRVLLPHYLRNEDSVDQVYLRTLNSYKEKNITLLVNTTVKSVNFEDRVVTFSDGTSLEYLKLLIASGGSARRLEVPGGDLEQVVYLRTLSDSQRIKELMNHSKEAVIVGSGFIGIELAQSFIANRLAAKTIIREKYFWQGVVGEESGKLLSALLEKNGVVIFPQSEVQEFTGKGRLESVKLKDGKTLSAEIAGVGVGIDLNLDFLDKKLITIDRGIVTNEFLETSTQHVWAAGDVAEFYDPIFGRYHLLGNWANASSQGRLVGANMTGEREPYRTTSMYSINIFKVNFSFLGDTTRNEDTQILERGNFESGKLAQLYIRSDIIVGASVINLPIERNILSELIKRQSKITVSKEKLGDLAFDLNSLLV